MKGGLVIVIVILILLVSPVVISVKEKINFDIKQKTCSLSRPAREKGFFVVAISSEDDEIINNAVK